MRPTQPKSAAKWFSLLAPASDISACNKKPPAGGFLLGLAQEASRRLNKGAGAFAVP